MKTAGKSKGEINLSNYMASSLLGVPGNGIRVTIRTQTVCLSISYTMRLSNWEALCILAKDTSYPSRMEGTVHVCEPGCQKFSQRYAILKGNLLFIFQKKSDQAPCLLIPADGFNLDICENSQGYNFRLNPIGGQETTGWFEFLAPSKEQFRAWIEALISCSYTELSNGSGMFEKELQCISKATEQEDALEIDVETSREMLHKGYALSRSGPVDAKYSRNQSFASLLSKFETEVLGKFYKKR
ncbi:hypothetical protein M514_01701 [Trichuris suis]|uniref:PH domain-containing protein n=1 Tax=Trichuris suis TaxID=68888 RepID=A0A085NSC9_9BILA|nr:hypothetical protein M513_01701 [Trichuris suis]KFD72375.1 hypothetical protein M514_01701 [Trichuris suis]